MGCTVSHTKIIPLDYELPKKKVMLLSLEHKEHLNTTNEVRKSSSIEEEPYLKETTERKLKEYADLLEAPNSNKVPKERFIAF